MLFDKNFFVNFLQYLAAAASCFDLQLDTLSYIIVTQAVWAILQHSYQPLNIKNLDLKSL